MQIGDGNLQINYIYHRFTWSDGVAPPPLVSVSGAIDSPYRGLGAFGEQDAPFFFGRETATTQLLERMSRQLPGTGLLVCSVCALISRHAARATRNWPARSRTATWSGR